jgi:outer membrane protein assembly factor BamB/tetratricopeptide (TPR) repeat protein
MRSEGLESQRCTQAPGTDRRPSRWLVVLLVCGWLAGTSDQSTAWAQRRMPRGAQGITGELLEAPRERRRLLEQAEAAIRDQQWSQATLLLGQLLGLEEAAERGGEPWYDHFLNIDLAGRSHQSLLMAARRLLQSLPEAGQSVMELRYGVEADRRLTAAIESGDWGAVRAVVGTYGFTRAGRDAMWLVAEWHLSQGDLQSAARIFDQLLESPAACERFGPGLGGLAALCWWELGDRGRAEARMAQAVSLWPAQTLQLGGGKALVLEPAQPAVWQAWFSSVAAADGLAQYRDRAEWLLPGGALDRAAGMPIGSPLPIARWHQELHESPQRREAALQTMRLRQESASMPIPASVPLVLGEYAVVRTYDQRLVGYHLPTGKLRWQSVHGGLPLDISPPQVDRVRDPAGGPLGGEVVNRIWGETVHAQLSSDGALIFGISELAAMESAEGLLGRAAAIGGNPLMQFQEMGRGRRSTNVLQAWSLPQEGKLLWEVGSESGLMEPLLANMFFLGPPVAVDGELLVIGELTGEQYLLSLDSGSGRLNWMQQLVVSSLIPVADDQTARRLGASPAVAGGLVICPTQRGQLVAVDLMTRTLAWAYAYQPPAAGAGQMRANPFAVLETSPFDPMANRSHETSPLIVRGLVLHLWGSGNAGTLDAIDLLTGEPRWRLSREQFRYVAGVWDRTLVLVGNDELRGVQLDDGETQWSLKLPIAGQQVVGRGGRSGDRVFVPLSDQSLLEVDVGSGELVGSSRVEKPLGNLVASGDWLLSLSPAELTAYQLRAPLEGRLARIALEEPESAWVMAKQGELLLADGQLLPALDRIERAYRQVPDDEDIRRLLMKVAIEALQSDYASYAERLQPWEQLLRDGEQPLYLRTVIEAQRQAGDYPQAFMHLLELAAFRSQRRQGGVGRQDPLQLEGNWGVAENRWLAAQASRLWEVADADQRRRISTALMQHIEPLRRVILPLRRELVLDFQWLPDAAPLLVELAEELTTTGELAAAEQLLLSMMALFAEADGGASDSLAAAAIQLSRIYQRAGFLSAAVRLQPLTGQPWEELLTAPEASTNLDPAALARSLEEQRLRELLEGRQRPSVGTSGWGLSPSRRIDAQFWKAAHLPLREWPRGAFVSHPIGVMSEALAIPEGQPVRLHVAPSSPLADLQMVLRRPGELRLIDRWGGGQWSMTIDSSGEFGPVPTDAYAMGSVMVLDAGDELLGVDLLSFLQPITDETVRSSSTTPLWRLPVAPPRRQAGGAARPGRYPAMTSQTADSFTLKPSGQPGGLRLARVTVPTHYGLVVRLDEELVCLDPVTGERQWWRSDWPTDIRLSCSGTDLWVVDPRSGRHRVDVRDGRLLDSVPWPTSMELMVANGSKALVQSKLAGAKRLEGDVQLELIDLVDPHQPLLQASFPADTPAAVHAERYLVVRAASGRMLLWDLVSGKQYEHRVLAEERLREIRLVSLGDYLVVVPYSSRYNLDVAGVTCLPEHNHPQYLSARGPLAALDKRDGSLAWEHEPVAHQLSIPVALPDQQPVLALMRIVKWIPDGQAPRQDVGVSLLDVRDGRLIFETNFLGAALSEAFEYQVNPASATVRFRLGGAGVEVRWVDDAQSVEPLLPKELGQVDLEQLLRQLKAADENGGGF